MPMGKTWIDARPSSPPRACVLPRSSGRGGSSAHRVAARHHARPTPKTRWWESSTPDISTPRYINASRCAQRRLQPLSLVLVGIAGSHEDPVQAIDSLVPTLKFSVRESDTVCRTAPDRLAMILEDATEYGAIFAVERARNMLRDLGNDHEMVVGVASYPSHAMELDELLSQAEDALARARLQPLSGFSVAEARL